MNKQLIFIDDSGNPGFKETASSPNLVMAAAIFIDTEEAAAMDAEIAAYRKTLGWREDHEFKFRKAPRKVKLKFLEIAAKHDFEIYAAYIRKTDYPTFFQLSDNEKVYNWTIKELLNVIPLNRAKIQIDGSYTKSHKRQVVTYIRQSINSSEHAIENIKPQDSVKNNLIQLADMVAGAINRSLQPDKTDSKDYIKIIRKKIIKLKLLTLR